LSSRELKLCELSYSDRQLFIAFYRSHKQKLAVKKNERLFMLFNGNTAVAALKISPIVIRQSAEQLTTFWLLRNMFVPENFRRQGYALSLLEHLKDDFIHLTEGSLGQGLFCFPWCNLTSLYTSAGFQLVALRASENLSDIKELPVEIVQRYRKYCDNGLDISLCRWC
jgi:hypothetical protein